MKTRSNDIIPNAPFSYNSNTGELWMSPSNRIIFDSIVDFEYPATFNDNLEVNGATIFKGNLYSYNDSAFSFYQGGDAQSPYMLISPLFNDIILSFSYNDGQHISSSINLDVSVEANILTDKNTKTFFGKSILKDSENNNIDLYRHQLEVRVGGGSIIYFVITSSSNLTIASLIDLATVTKATNGYFTLGIHPGETSEAVLVTFNNNVWGSSLGPITEITEDKVQPI